tara:strand:- start:1103 stop:1816 length:714 start_codon:yes stop_codon:yes gene_type:complete
MFNLLKNFTSKNEIIMDVKVIRSKKRIKSVLTRVRNGRPEIVCPYFSTQKYLKNVIIKNQKWIIRKINEDKKKNEYLQRLKDGKFIFFLGKKYNIQVKLNKKKKIEIIDNNVFVSYIKKDYNIALILKKWLKDLANSYLSKRTKELAKETKINFKILKIKNYKARWGCCNLKSEISLNWKLIMLPKKIIDYVIIHELVHIREPNHSKSFWSLLRSFDPDYKEKDKWLKRNGNPIILF